MKLYDYLKSGFINEGDYNCAERMLIGANAAYDLGLTKDAMRLSAGFGGGMGVMGVCGAISGAVMALSYMFVREYAHESDRIKRLSSELVTRTEETLSSSNCEVLRGLYRTESEKCSHILYTVAKIFDDIAERELAAASAD